MLRKHNELLQQLIANQRQGLKTSAREPQSLSDTPYSMWEVRTQHLIACNTAFQKLVGYSMTELSSDFPCPRLVPPRYHSHLRRLWEFVASTLKTKMELQMCFQEKGGSEKCLRTIVLPMFDQNYVLMEHHLVDYCDDKWVIGDFVHFATFKTPPQQFTTTPMQSINDVYNLMQEKKET